MPITDYNFTSPTVNFTAIMADFNNWWSQGFTSVLGFAFYPVIFVTIIGYVYFKQQSIVSASVATLLLCSIVAGTNFWANVPELVSFLQIMVALAFTGIIVYWLIKRRN